MKRIKLDALALELGVSRSTIQNRITDGWIPGETPFPFNPPRKRKVVMERDAVSQALRNWRRPGQ